MTVREAKRLAIKDVLLGMSFDCTRRGPALFTLDQWAEKALTAIEVAEIVEGELQHEADLLTYDGPSALEASNA